MYGKVNVNFFPYSFGGKKGVGCGLGPVMKTRDGEALGGSAPTAAQAFGFAQQPGAPNPYQAPQAATYVNTPPQAPASYAAPARRINPVPGLPM